MEKRLIKKNDLVGVITKLANELNVYAPVMEEENCLFKKISDGKDAVLGSLNTKNAPKGFLFPCTELMMKYVKTNKGVVFSGDAAEAEKTVLFGVKPCDARSFYILDFLFDQDVYKDSYYIDKREKTIVITMSCTHPPYASCFCTSVGGSPTSTEGADINITDLGDNYLAEFLTDKGDSLLKYFGDSKADSKVDKKKMRLQLDQHLK